MYGKWCLKSCMAPADCRTPGYACFTFGSCFPNGNLSCDPTAGDGTCPVDPADATNLNGGCLRNALGTGTVGRCDDACQVGTNTCAPDTNGDPQICIISDETRNLDGTASMDKYLGGVCTTKVMTPLGNNVECLYTPTGATMSSHYIDVCNDGYECYLKGMGTGGGFDSKGDNLCRQLCTPPGGVAGMVPDGGVAAPTTCANGTLTCKPVWGPNKFGLCVAP